jgi:ATP-dependent DNA ligase
MDDGSYIATFKRDGWRGVLFHTPEGQHEVWSRHNERLDTLSDFDPKITEAFKALKTPPDTQIDGEWERRRAGNKEGTNRIAVFGILRWAGEWLSIVPEEQRWVKTLALPLDGQYLFVPEHTESSFRAFFEDSKKDWANEGIVLKHKKSKLVLSRGDSEKNRGWFKIKWRDGPDGQTLTDF